MTSELKCPFCGEGLLFWGVTGSMRKCPKCDNNLLGNKELWQALIQSQKDLEESQQATLQNAQTVLEIHKDLNFVIKVLVQIAELALAHDDISIADEVVGVFDALKQQDLADKIREQITHDNSEKANSVEYKEI